MKDRKVKQVLSGDRYQWKGGGYKGRMNKSDYGGCILYSCMKIEMC
jgi:hypothetical protein